MNALSNRDAFDRITEDDAFEAEQVFFACMFSDNSILTDCGLEAEDFGEDIHQTAFAESLELYRGGQHVNSVSLKPSLPRLFKVRDASDRKLKIEVTPAEYLSKLTIMGANPAVRALRDAKIEIIKSMALGRRVAHEGQIMAAIGEEGHTLLTLADEIERAEQRLKDLKARFRETTSIASPGASYLSMFEASAKRDGVLGVPIALPEIAKVLSEPVFEAGNLYGLLSSSGEGKSSLTMQLIYHAVSHGHPVLFLSYDQSAAQCVRQMIAQVHEISVRQQREPSRLMTDYERDKCVMFATEINSKPFDIIRCQREGVDKLVAYARRFIKKRANGKTPFIVIDHIGKVKPRDPKLSADRISSDVTVELKALADETQASVLVLNQRNSFGTRRDNPRPIAADLYGGEGAKADYDAILYLYRAEKYKAERVATAATGSDWKKINSVFIGDLEGVAEVGSVKCRFGDPTLQEHLKFEAEYTRYVSQKPKRTQEEMF